MEENLEPNNKATNEISDNATKSNSEEIKEAKSEVLDIKDPPIIVISKKYKLKLLSFLINVIPELAKLLNTLIIKLRFSKSLKQISKIRINIKQIK